MSLRNLAYPFDYVGHIFIDSILNKIEKEELLVVTMLEILDVNNEQYFFTDKYYDFRYWHDKTFINKNDIIDKDYIDFITKFNRRYKRLYDDINSNKNILFILNLLLI